MLPTHPASSTPDMSRVFMFDEATFATVAEIANALDTDVATVVAGAIALYAWAHRTLDAGGKIISWPDAETMQYGEVMLPR
jgi:hypothetical protein